MKHPLAQQQESECDEVPSTGPMPSTQSCAKEEWKKVTPLLPSGSGPPAAALQQLGRSIHRPTCPLQVTLARRPLGRCFFKRKFPGALGDRLWETSSGATCSSWAG